MKHSNRLRVLRAERDITQIDLALKAKIAHIRYWKIEKGYAEPTTNEKKRIARALKFPVEAAFPQSEAVAS